MRITPPFTPLTNNELFAADERSAQLVVRATTDDVVIDIDGRQFVSPTTHGAAVVEVAGLAPDTGYTAVLSDSDGRSLGELTFRTRPRLGEVIARFATVSDVHLGAAEFGPAKRIQDDDPTPHTLRCGRAAVAECAAWGAELLLVKGDLTDTGVRDEWVLAQQMLANAPIPFRVTPGNHDQWKTRELDPGEGASMLGVSADPVQTVELDGVRLVLADTSKPNKGTGDMARMRNDLVEAATTDTPTFIGIHHNIQRLPIPWFWPPGTPSTNAMPVVDALAAANPSLFLSSGHTHRNRAHHLGPDGRVTYTEVSATADYPGVWAGYEVTERSIRQTVRRIASPEAVSWTESTRAALAGVWPRWSQGQLSDRCVDAIFQ